MGQVIDAGVDEISFSYWYAKGTSASGPFLPSQGTLEILCEKDKFLLSDVPVMVAFNVEQRILNSSDYIVSEWHCGLTFGKIFDRQMFEFKRFLATCIEISSN